MDIFRTFLREYLILVPAITWFIVIVLKAIFLLLKGKFSFEGALGSGGMPSAHSAFVTSITTAVGIKHGLTNDLFAMGIIFSTIVIYDAINVRFEAGLHAKALNELTGKEYDFNESIGHLPQEAFVGSIIGILVAFVLMSL